MQKTIPHLDLLRVVACFMVVLSHSCDPFVSQFDANPDAMFSGIYWGSALRACVPLFIMISGVLLLPVKLDMATFYSKRLKRVLIPLAFWAVVTPLVYYWYVNSGVTILNMGIAPESYTWNATLTKMYSWVFNFNYDITPLWYLYMLVGIYLFLPIIGAWLAQASQKDIKRFLYIWGITLFVPYLQLVAPLLGYTGNYSDMGLLGVCLWNPYGMFYYFAGFLGYVVLAHYLTRFPLNWSWTKTWAICVPLFVVGYFITSQGILLAQSLYAGNYAYLEIPWYFSGINVAMMTIALFILLSKVKIKPHVWLSKLAGLTFGVYLTHFFIVGVFFDVLYGATTGIVPPYLQIPMIATCAFISSAFVVWVLSKIPYLRKTI